MSTGRTGVVAILTALTLTGCERFQRAPTQTGVACLPQAARAFVQTSTEDEASEAGRVDLYVDASGSMIGYLRGPDLTMRRPFQDLVAELRSATMGGGERRYHLFGRTIRALDAGSADQLVRETPYSCANPDRSKCDNQETRLDLVLQRVASSPADALSVIVTDLWLSAADLSANGSVTVGAPAAALLGEGRAIGLLGVRAPYDGRIYDLPSGASVPYKGERPLFVLVAGPTERVVAFREHLATAGLRGFGASDARFSLFTADPLKPGAAGELSFAGAAWDTRPVLPGNAAIDLPQATLASTAAIREGEGGSTIRFAANAGASVREGAVWQGATTGAVTAYSLRGHPCGATAWTESNRLEGGWSEAGWSLSGAEAAAQLPRGTYLLVGEQRRNGLTTPNPANAWLREWSFNASTEPQVIARKPELFPTLNLAETAQILEAAADEAARRAPVPLSGFAAVVKTE